MPGDAGALAAGIVTGNDAALSDAAVAAFRRTGTSHITAVSGSNVGVVLAIWYAVVPPGKLRRRRLVRLVIILSVWTYALMVGFEPPAIRAALVTTGVLIGARAGRRPDPLTLLALASGIMVIASPRTIEQVSFWLSVVASAAIITRVPAVTSSSRLRTVKDLALGVAMAQLCTLPIILLAFGSWSMAGLVANLVLAPVIGVAFPLCFALAALSLIAPPLAEVLAPVCTVPLELALALVSTFAKTAPALAFGESGPIALIAVALPCLLAMAILSRDVQRWLGRLGSLFD